jgi:alpha-1,3-rhamnosyl/mannosyltransferase
LALYQGALAMVYPSQYEGFGLQVLEAMASGCPVIASTRGALPEVVGDSGTLVDISSPNELSEAMSHLCRDSSFREGLIRKGLERIGQFSWACSFGRRVIQGNYLHRNGFLVDII